MKKFKSRDMITFLLTFMVVPTLFWLIFPTLLDLPERFFGFMAMAVYVILCLFFAVKAPDQGVRYGFMLSVLVVFLIMFGVFSL